MKIFKNKTILITGGTGSLGQQLTKRLLQSKVKKIIIYSRDEFKQYNMAREIPEERIRFFIGDVRDSLRLRRALEGVDYVVHAAALKHVPICEYNPIEAIQTNVLGAVNVINQCLDQGVKKVVALSTDKGVNPVNLYGASKLCSDKIFISGNAYSGKRGTRFSVVRYGNVAESRGSVIPLFKKLKAEGLIELPVTSEKMTRFHITLDQGIDLIIKAFNEMQGGEIFVAKIPSYRIKDIVNHLGCKSNIIGVRPGEKLHEIMITREDSNNTYDCGDHYLIINPDYARPRGRKVMLGFEYRSDNNIKWVFN